MRFNNTSSIKFTIFLLLIISSIISLYFIIRYAQHTSPINIERMPNNNSRLNQISLNYRHNTDTNQLINSAKSYQELFSIDDLQQRRDYIVNYFNTETSQIAKPVVGDYFTAVRLAAVQLHMQLNGPGNTSVLTELAKATSLNSSDFESLLKLAQATQSIDDYLESYPNLASVEWEVFIQSQELIRLLQEFA